MMPDRHRFAVWHALDEHKAGDVLWEVADSVADNLVRITDHLTLLAICRQMEADTLSQIADHLPREVLQEIKPLLTPPTSRWLKTYDTFPPDSVGRLITRGLLVIRETSSISGAIDLLRERGSELEDLHCLFVVDAKDRLLGVADFRTLLLHEPDRMITEIMDTDIVTFAPSDDAGSAALVFEHYDIVTAPVLDERGRLMGQLCFDVIWRYILFAVQTRGGIKTSNKPGKYGANTADDHSSCHKR